MQPDYSEFQAKYPRYKAFSDDKLFQEVFEYLSLPRTIAQMIEANDRGKPALSGCISRLEKLFPDLLSKGYSPHLVCQAIGTMVKVILEPFGYTPEKQKRMPQNYSQFFASASLYKYELAAEKLKVVQKYSIERAI